MFLQAHTVQTVLATLSYWKVEKKLYVIISLIFRARVLNDLKMLGNVAHEWLGMIESYPVSPPPLSLWSIIQSDLNWAPILNKGGGGWLECWTLNCEPSFTEIIQAFFFIWSIYGEFLELLSFGMKLRETVLAKAKLRLMWSNLKEMDFICNQPNGETWEKHSKQWLICCGGTQWPCSPLVLFTHSQKKKKRLMV